MNDRERELLDALISPLNKLRGVWESREIPMRLPSPRPAPILASASKPDSKRSKACKKAREKGKLPRGIRRRGNSLEVYLTFPDHHAERRSMGNVSVGMLKSSGMFGSGKSKRAAISSASRKPAR